MFHYDPEEKTTHVIDVFNVKASSSHETWEVYQTEDGATYSEQEYQVASKVAKKIKSEFESKKIKERKDGEQMLKEIIQTELSGIQLPTTVQTNTVTTEAMTTAKATTLKETTMKPTEVITTGKEIVPGEETTPAEVTTTIQPTDSDIQDNFRKLVEDILSKDHDDIKESILELSIWDFAGQGLYYTCHKVFLSSASIFIVAFDLSKDMNEMATDWIEEDYTNGQVLEFWIDSIYAYTKTSEPLSVLLVGTHAGQVPQTQIKKSYEYIHSVLFRKSYFRDIFNENFKDMFYTVENSIELSKNDEAQRLKSYIEKEIIPTIVKSREKQPLTWLEFEKKLKTLQNGKGEEKQWATLDEVKDEAVLCKVITDREDEETLIFILHFLHNIGSIVYYGRDDKALGNMVIIKPEWLIEVFKKIIIVPKPEIQDLNCRDSWQKLKEKHILTNSLMEHVLGDLEETKSSIIKLMIKYDLLCEHVRDQDSETAYYVPFILVQEKSDIPIINERPISKNIQFSNTDTAFVINFHGFLPSGVFHQLAVKTLKWSEECRINGTANTYEPEIYYRYLDVFIESNHLLSLEWMKNAQIKVILKRCSYPNLQNILPDSSLCLQVLDFLRQGLTELETMGLRHIDYEFEIDLNDYPQWCRCSSRLNLDSCLDSDGKLACPAHSDSFIDVTDIQKRFDDKGKICSSSTIHQPEEQPELTTGSENTAGIALLVNREWGTSKGSINTINHQIGSQVLKGNLEVYCMVVKADQADMEDAKRHNVTLRKFPFDWKEHFDTVMEIFRGGGPRSEDVEVVIGHACDTHEIALDIKKELYPHAKYISFLHAIPEDSDTQDQSMNETHKKQQNLVWHAYDRDVDAIVSIGPRIFEFYLGQLPKFKKPHLEYLPYPKSINLEERIMPPHPRAPRRILTFAPAAKSIFKGCNLLACSVGRLADAYHMGENQLDWIVYGVPDKESTELKKYLVEHAKSKHFHIKILPYISHDDIIKQLELACIFLMGYCIEPFGLVGLEAIALGVPTLITGLSGLAKLLLSSHFKRFSRQCVVDMPSNLEAGTPAFEATVDLWMTKIRDILKEPVTAFEGAEQLKQALHQAVEDGAIFKSRQEFIEYCLQ